MAYFSNGKCSDLEINLSLAYILVFVTLSIKPYYFETWLVENITVWFGVILFVSLRLRHKFSSIATIIFFLACCTHTIGGHFSFQLVPFKDLYSFAGPMYRNNFDRVGHFLCGMLAYPVVEFIFYKQIIAFKKWACFFSVMTMIGVAAVYELIEWLDVIIAHKRFGEIYLGVQNDPWDAQADMLMCLIGALFSTFLFLCVDKLKKQRCYHYENK